MAGEKESGAGVTPLRVRHDGFTAEKRARFFKAFRKSGCIADAARVAGVSVNTVNRWKAKARGFAEAMAAARGLAADALEIVAWQRATVGAREVVIRDGKVIAEKIKPSDAMLRLLLQGARPEKYGRLGRGGETKKQIEKRLRAEIEAELRGELGGREPEDVAAEMKERLDEVRRRLEENRMADGWTRTEDGDWIPPGWVKAG